jgi:hypothetical protein
MKTKFLKAVLKDKQRCGLALLSFLCLFSFAITPGSAQFLKQKRITALQFGYAAEGSRVTLVSDSALGDYEAFRRGDRFYVKIPLAEFNSGPPRCCASGFEDVQVQRVGDSLIVSFRLQPGATARVDQRSNRLDVIFSSPDRTFRNNSLNAASNRVATGTNVSRNLQDRGSDAAGPIPPGSTPAFRQRVLTEGMRANGSQLSPNPLLPSNRPSDSSKGSNKQSVSGNNQLGGNNQRANESNQSGTGNNQSSTSKAQTELSSPAASQSPNLSPSNSRSYPGLTSAPAASVSSTPAVNASESVSNWGTRGKAIRQWVSANRLATLLGALILLSLILYLAAALSRRRKKLNTSKRVAGSKIQPKVQPNLSTDALFDELLNSRPITSPAPNNPPKEFVKPASAAAVVAATPQNRSRVPTKPSVASPSAGHEYSSSEEEREVFEL